ncbi:MAG TPA: hypothetical protein PLD95_03920 [bacterium]|jgi:hypothetical protein|nr:hypothetical protein [bacterium]HOG38589.1 hypothetical protein [bacterium]
MKIKKILFIIILNCVLLPLLKINAQSAYSPNGDAGYNMDLFAETAGIKSTSTSLLTEALVIKYIKMFLGFLGFIFLILIIIAGFKWMTSGGNDEIIKKSKAMIKSAIIGILIVLLSYIITAIVMKLILGNILTNGYYW